MRHSPDYVVEQLLAMRQQRKKHLHAIIEINNRIGNNTMRFFPDLTAFQQVYPDGNFIDWKIYQSVAAELYARTIWSGFVNFSTERNCRCYNNNERILTQHRYTF